MIPGTVIVAVFNEEDQLIDISSRLMSVEVEGVSGSFILNVPIDLAVNTSYAKVFVWDNLQKQTILALPTTRNITN